MKRYFILVILIVSTIQAASDWTRTAQIGDVDFWSDFTEDEITEGIDRAHEQGLTVVMAWVTSENIDIPQEDLNALKKAVTYMHETYPDMKFIVYQAPLEIITENVDKNRDGNPDKGVKTISTEHPEWLQVGMDGRKAIFYGDFEFWIGRYDEDVWCCPNDPVYKEKVKESVRTLAQTGIDGIWFDVVRFLCDFGDWEQNWACHCDDCQRKFYEETGLRIPDKVTWDSAWKTWVLWRFQCIEDFVKELSETAKSVNPYIQIIVEHWHGFDAEATQDAWSPVGLQTVTDVLAHEYESASSYLETYTPVNYIQDMAVYQFYRGVDRNHPSWMLVYSQEKKGQKMLAAAVLEAGCNYYDTILEDMAESVSSEQRTRIFQWLKKYSDYYYASEPVCNVALYYSKATVDFYDCFTEDWEFYREFMGVSMMLLQLHIPYTVITDLEHIEQDILILPHTVCLSDYEEILIKEFLDEGGYVVTTGETGYYDEMGREQSVPNFSGYHRVFSTDRLFGNEYYEEVNPFFYPEEAGHQGSGDTIRREFYTLLEQVPYLRGFEASRNTVVIPSILENTLVFRVITFEGISPGDAVPTPQSVSVTPRRDITKAVVIPFLQSPENVDFNATVTVQVEDHCLLLLDVEPVSIFCNEYDLPTAQNLASFLQKRGIPVQFVDSPENASTLIVFGGHRAVKTGDFVSSLLTEEQKTQLDQPGFSQVFVIEGERLIIIIAGNEREDTAHVAENNRRYIFELL